MTSRFLSQIINFKLRQFSFKMKISLKTKKLLLERGSFWNSWIPNNSLTTSGDLRRRHPVLSRIYWYKQGKAGLKTGLLSAIPFTSSCEYKCGRNSYLSISLFCFRDLPCLWHKFQLLHATSFSEGYSYKAVWYFSEKIWV